MNKFDITRDKTQKTGISEETFRKMLSGYSEVDKSKWKDLPIRTEIRYQNNDGSYKKGGFIQEIVQSNDEFGFVLDTAFKPNQKSFGWRVMFSNLSKIWKKNNTDTTTVNEPSKNEIYDGKDGNRDENRYREGNREILKKIEELESKINNLSKAVIALYTKISNG